MEWQLISTLKSFITLGPDMTADTTCVAILNVSMVYAHFRAIQDNTIKHNATRHNDIQHNDIQHNDIQHNESLNRHSA
jgi:hypothetical protein